MGSLSLPSSLLDTRWRVVAADSPRIVRWCAHCANTRRFRSRGAFRVTANGRKLGAGRSSLRGRVRDGQCVVVRRNPLYLGSTGSR